MERIKGKVGVWNKFPKTRTDTNYTEVSFAQEYEKGLYFYIMGFISDDNAVCDIDGGDINDVVGWMIVQKFNL